MRMAELPEVARTLFLYGSSTTLSPDCTSSPVNLLLKMNCDLAGNVFRAAPCAIIFIPSSAAVCLSVRGKSRQHTCAVFLGCVGSGHHRSQADSCTNTRQKCCRGRSH